MTETRQIQIIAYKGKSLFSKLVRWKTSSQYSHTEVINNYELNGFDTFGAINMKGVMWCKINWHTKGTPYDVYSIDITEEQYINFWKFLMKQRGKKYDVKGIFGYVANKPYDDINKWYCSELCFRALERVGVMLFNKPLKFPSPDLTVLSKDLKLIKSGVVGKEVKEDKDLEKMIENIKEQGNIQGDTKENANKEAN